MSQYTSATRCYVNYFSGGRGGRRNRRPQHADLTPIPAEFAGKVRRRARWCVEQGAV